MAEMVGQAVEVEAQMEQVEQAILQAHLHLKVIMAELEVVLHLFLVQVQVAGLMQQVEMEQVLLVVLAGLVLRLLFQVLLSHMRVAVVGVHIMVVQAVPEVLVAAALVAMVILLHLMGLLEQSIPEVAAVVVALIQIPE
jgi:hypothetical protein